MGNKTSGFGDFKKKITSMKNNLESNVAKLEEETIEVGYNTATKKVPVDSGDLKKSITKDKGSLTVNADHGASVEFGTYNMPAQPYFRPAYEDMQKNVEDNIGGVLDDTK